MMTHSWKIVDSGIAEAQHNMKMDVDLLASFEKECLHHPILHLYDWDAPSVTYGHFINPYDLLNKDEVQYLGLKLAQRPTGGGVVFHVSDFAFSILIPASHKGYSVNTLENYAYVNNLVIDVICEFTDNRSRPQLTQTDGSAFDADGKHFCMAKPTKYDVILDGRKVGGGAQRRTRYGLLHQGTISLALPPEVFLKKVLKPDTRVLEAMKVNTCSLLGGDPASKDLEFARSRLRHIFKSLLIT